MKPIDMTPREVLLDAIRSEVETRNFYLRLAEQTDDAELKKRLVNLADRELLHRAKLERKYMDRFDEDPPRPEPRPVETTATPIVDARHVLKLALDHERNSESEYRHLAARSKDPELARLFVELAEVEWTHKTEIENEYNALADPDDFLSDL